MKEIEEDKSKWKDIPCSLISRISISTISLVLKAIADLMKFAKIPMAFSQKLKNNPKFI
jgi:hypothetical protein